MIPPTEDKMDNNLINWIEIIFKLMLALFGAAYIGTVIYLIFRDDSPAERPRKDG